MSSHSYRIRRATLSDMTAVRDLTRQAYAKWVAVIGREPRPMTVDFGQALSSHQIDLFEHEGELIGLIEMIPRGDHLLIENVAVRETWQGKGIGSAALDHAATVARKLGLPELRLYTNAAFASNLLFYGRKGFTETTREQLSDGGTMVHFAKPVS